jgi:hypothetical protein
MFNEEAGSRNVASTTRTCADPSLKPEYLLELTRGKTCLNSPEEYLLRLFISLFVLSLSF